MTATRLLSRAERISDAVVHVAGVTAALMSAPVLITLAFVWRGDLPAVAGAVIYTLSLIAMLGCSALYHMVPHADWRCLLRRLDHSAIYIKIAGTYTPFAMMSGVGGGLIAGLWGAAVAGSSLYILSPERMRWIGFALYLAMGWAGVVAGGAIIGAMSAPVFALVVAGGALYTIGTAFYVQKRLRFHTTIWHAFVLVATALFYVAIARHLADTATLLTLPLPG